MPITSDKSYLILITDNILIKLKKNMHVLGKSVTCNLWHDEASHIHDNKTMMAFNGIFFQCVSMETTIKASYYRDITQMTG